MLDLERVSETRFRMFYQEKVPTPQQASCKGDSGGGAFIQNYNKKWVLIGLLTGGRNRMNNKETNPSAVCSFEFTAIEKLAPLKNWIQQVIESR